MCGEDSSFATELKKMEPRPRLFPCAPKFDTGRLGYLSLLGGLTHLEKLRGSVCLTIPECRVTVGLSEAIWMNGNWSTLRVAGSFLKGDKTNNTFVWLAKQPKKAKLELTVTGLAHS